MVEQNKASNFFQPAYRRFLDNSSDIFDDICQLQGLIQMETELKQTFFMRFDEMVNKTLRQQVFNFAESQLTLQSELE